MSKTTKISHLTIKQMVKDMLLDAINEKRTEENFTNGMTVVIERLRYYFYYSYFEAAYFAWLNGSKTSKQIMSQIADRLRDWTVNEEARLIRKTILELI